MPDSTQKVAAAKIVSINGIGGVAAIRPCCTVLGRTKRILTCCFVQPSMAKYTRHCPKSVVDAHQRGRRLLHTDVYIPRTITNCSAQKLCSWTFAFLLADRLHGGANITWIQSTGPPPEADREASFAVSCDAATLTRR